MYVLKVDASVHGTHSSSAINQAYQPYTGDRQIHLSAGNVDPRYAPSVPYAGPKYAPQHAGFGASRAKSSEEVRHAYRQPGVGGYRSAAGVEAGRMEFDRSRNVASQQAAVDPAMPRSTTQPLWNRQRAPAVSFILALIANYLLHTGFIEPWKQ